MYYIHDDKIKLQILLICWTDRGNQSSFTLLASNLDCSVRRKNKNCWMAVKDADNIQSSTSKVETCFGHLYIRVVVLLVISIENAQIEGIGVEISDVGLGGWVSHPVEDLMGCFDV